MASENIKMNKFIPFTPFKGRNRQRLPPERRYVLVMLKNLDPCFPNPIVVGYLKYHAGVKSEPYFVTPGATINCPNGDDRVIAWSDCLPDNFTWPCKLDDKNLAEAYAPINSQK